MRPARARWVPLLAAVAAAACDYGFKPETLVDQLRVLGVQATPADLRPGESARLSALAPDPSRPGGAVTLLWVGCDADPYGLGRTACADATLLQDPSALTGGTGQLPAGVSLIGFNDTAAWTAPAGLFDVLDAGDPRRQTGTVGPVVLFAVAEAVSPTATRAELQALFERVQRKEVRSVLSLYRVKVPESLERNHGPTLTGLTVDGGLWPQGAWLTVRPGEPLPLDLRAPPEAFEAYTALTPDGPVASTERLLAAWYATSGRFSQERTALGAEVKTAFTPPGSGDPTDPLPPRRAGTLWAVVRDTRGGQTWDQWPFYVCDPSLPEPRVTGVDWPASPGDLLVLHGTALDSVLDVVVDGQALTRGGYAAARGTWEGPLPGGVPVGARRGTVVARTCSRQPL